MAEDISAHMQLAISVFLTACLLSTVIGLLVLELNYTHSLTNRFIEAVTETNQKDFQNLVSSSDGVPVNGAEIYRVCMNTGLMFESIKVSYIDGTTREVSMYDSGYTEDKMETFVEYFMTEDTTRLFTMSAIRQTSTLWELKCIEVEGGD